MIQVILGSNVHHHKQCSRERKFDEQNGAYYYSYIITVKV